jgi:16S rRNA (cytosine1402-N4)-methyltransferase
VITGEHHAVMLAQAVDALNITGERANGVYVDGTFGRGGHSRRILELLGSGGRLIALDRDADAIRAGESINDQRFKLIHGWFGELGALLTGAGAGAGAGVAKVDGILLDLGVSSPQLDDAARGFSFRFDAPLDMRMDISRGMSAAQWLAVAEESEIREVIKHHGEERFAKQIAAAIVAARAVGPVGTTRQLAALVAHAVPAREPRQDPATRTFQALRIHLNRELEELSLVLPQCVDALNPGGRLAVISFHSLEDRIVKRHLREAAAGAYVPARLPLRASEMLLPAMRLVGKAQRPGADEIARNPRARSAILRVAERTEHPMNSIAS